MTHPTVADFQLARSLNTPGRWFADPDCFFLDPVVPRAANTNDKWTEHRITLAPGADAAATRRWDAEDAAFEYSLSVALGVLIVRRAFLVDAGAWPPARYTDMRASQLLVDAWRSAACACSSGGHTAAARSSPPPPRYLAFHHVVDKASLPAMRAEADQQIGHGVLSDTDFEAGRAVEFDETSVNWAKTQFVNCADRVAREFSNEAQQVTATKGWIMHEGKQLQLHLIVELTNEWTDQEEEGAAL